MPDNFVLKRKGNRTRRVPFPFRFRTKTLKHSVVVKTFF